MADTPAPDAGAPAEREFKTWPPLSAVDEYRRKLKQLHRAGERVEFAPHPVHVDQKLATFESESPERLDVFKQAADSLVRQVNKFKGERDYRAFYADLTSHPDFWETLFAIPRNYVIAERTVDILQMVAIMNRQRHDVAGAESVLAFNNRVLTRLELHMRAICALPLDAATNGDVPNLKLADRIQASRCCKTLRYKHTMVRFNCIVQRFMDLGDRPTAANLGALKEALVPLLRRQLLHEVDFQISFEESQYLSVVLPKLRGSRANRSKGDVTREEIESLSDDELFRLECIALNLHDPSARAELKRHDLQQSMQNGSLLRQCARPGCGKPEEARGDFKSCSACKSASYCGAECQRAHWKGAHKAECAQLKATASAAGGPVCDD